MFGLLSWSAIADILSIIPGLHGISASVSQHPAHINATGCSNYPSRRLMAVQSSVTNPLQAYWVNYCGCLLFISALSHPRLRYHIIA
jgi:hypothetical protein